MIPPYDHPHVLAGQGTCGLEILEQLSELTGEVPDETTLVLSPVSGGGLLSGVATAIKLASEAAGHAAPVVYGTEPELAADSEESFGRRRWWSGRRRRRRGRSAMGCGRSRWAC